MHGHTRKHAHIKYSTTYMKFSSNVVIQSFKNLKRERETACTKISFRILGFEPYGHSEGEGTEDIQKHIFVISIYT